MHSRLVLCCGKVPLTARHRLRDAGIIAVEVGVCFPCCVGVGFLVPCRVLSEVMDSITECG